MYQLLDQASRATSDPQVQARIDELILYTRYVELYRAYRSVSGEPRQQTLEELLRFSYSIRETNMVHVAAIFRDLPRRDRGLDASFETLWSVGSLEGAEWETFGEVGDVAFDAAGNLHILDAQSARVVVVDPRGRLLRTVGRPGEGPGELRMAAGMAVLRDGTVAVADLGHRAFVVYGPDGEFLHQSPFGGDGGTTVLGELLPEPAGRGVVSAGRRMVMVRRGGPGGATEDPGQPIVRFDLAPEGGSRTLLRAWEPPPPEGGGAGAVAGGARVTMPPERAFEPRLLAAMLPDGSLVFSDSSAYALKVAGPDGRVKRILRRPLEPRRTTARIQEAEKRRRLAEMEAGEGPQISVRTTEGGGPRTVSQDQIRDMMRRRIDGLLFYPEVPVVQAVAAGWSGKVWVRRRGRDAFEDGPVDVLDAAAGTYLGTLEPATRIPDAFGPDGVAAWVERDALDVPTVVVRRLPPALR
ncbi:MAG: hypothetical protein KY453_05170, partial [Gemmatimonadetes bacterium]|nr:hypothetical protein [Gemmatimonadota bacterium]